MAIKRSRLGGSQKDCDVGKKVTRLNKTEAKAKGEFGLFAHHFAGLLKAAGLSHQAFSEQCKKRGIEVEEHAVRSWLRGESMPKSHMLRDLGRVLKLDDPRHILPG